VRHGGAEAVEKVLDLGPAHTSAHALEDPRAHVLERQVDVRHERQSGGELVDQFRRHRRRVRVHQAEPPRGGPLAQVLDEVRDAAAVGTVAAVGGRVLTDKHEFLRPVGDEFLGLFEDALGRLGAQGPADVGNGAVRAAVVAALGDAQVGGVARGEPEAPKGGGVLHVYPSGHEGKRPAGAILGLAAAYAKARPGDILLLHAGLYDEGTLEFTKSGAPAKPIVFRGAGDGESVLQGRGHGENLIEMAQADYLWFEGLTFRRARTAILAGTRRAGARGLVVRRCKIEDVIMGVWSTSRDSANWYIADCVLIGTNRTWYPRPKAYMSPSHTGVNVYGQGIVVCHNRITRFSDALAIANHGPPSMDPRKQCVAVDFYNNDLSWAQDDPMEADYGCHNIRVYRNRCYNAHTGLSVQPSYGGPIYLIRNEVFGVTALSLKLHNYCTGLEIYHNTLLTAGQGFRSFHKWQNGILRNNLILGARRYAMETGSLTPYTSLDYNGYRRADDPGRFIKWYDGSKWGRYPTLKEFTQATGHERHGIEVDYDIFVKAAKPEEGKTSRPSDLDLRLRRGAAPVDAGCVLPNVNDEFTGKAPDLGCYEVGKPRPHYGPRPRE